MILSGFFVIGKIEQDYIKCGNLFGSVYEYVDFDTAYEVFFENGALNDMTDISSAHQEYHQFANSHKCSRQALWKKKAKIAIKHLKGCYYEAPYYVRESSYPDGKEIRIMNEPYELLNGEK